MRNSLDIFDSRCSLIGSSKSEKLSSVDYKSTAQLGNASKSLDETFLAPPASPAQPVPGLGGLATLILAGLLGIIGILGRRRVTSAH